MRSHKLNNRHLRLRDDRHLVGDARPPDDVRERAQDGDFVHALHAPGLDDEVDITVRNEFLADARSDTKKCEMRYNE